ncbi:hypothetical protein EJB05_56755, partial [Eragrostis curvula]
MASATSKLHMALAAVLFLALVVAAAAGIKPGTCQLEAEAKACAEQIIGKVFTPDCCNQLASGPLGCACLVRDLVLATGIDTQKPFCIDGSACTKY